MYVILLHAENNLNVLGLSAELIICTGLVTLFCYCFIFGIAICVIKNRSASKEDGEESDTVEGHEETKDQFTDIDGDMARHYENDDQFTDIDGDMARHYENDDQFTDINGDMARHYENDDQFTDINGDMARHYENDDQFTDINGDMARHYENDDQFTEIDGDMARHYENDDQFLDASADLTRLYENNDQFKDRDGDMAKHYENDDQFPDEERAFEGHYGNGINAESAFKTGQAYDVSDAIQEMAPPLYNSNSVEEQQGPIVQVDEQATDNNLAHEYVTFPDSQKTTGEQQGATKVPKECDVMVFSDTKTDDVLDHGRVTFPSTPNTCEKEIKTRNEEPNKAVGEGK
ncbi:Hypp8529 [Branchiostoma lanceolatum]|uniref:Hypp8529 protein n=1 Tax=Branchiostoma lanceolatum TaxID=7740 RepID=A0A8J9Z8X2_BRALA|nr:Hypp8529 [Branchiostoma lanceolatum]